MPNHPDLPLLVGCRITGPVGPTRNQRPNVCFLEKILFIITLMLFNCPFRPHFGFNQLLIYLCLVQHSGQTSAIFEAKAARWLKLQLVNCELKEKRRMENKGKLNFRNKRPSCSSCVRSSGVTCGGSGGFRWGQSATFPSAHPSGVGSESTHLRRCSRHTSWGHSNQEAQRSPRVRGPRADRGLLGSRVGLKDPGCPVCPAPEHLWRGRSSGQEEQVDGTDQRGDAIITGWSWRSSGALDPNTWRSFLPLLPQLTWTHTHTHAASPDSPGSASVWVRVGQHLSLPASRSVHSVPGSPVCLVVPAPPGCPEAPFCRVLLGVLVPCGWTLADWERGSGWSCIAPGGLRSGESWMRLKEQNMCCGPEPVTEDELTLDQLLTHLPGDGLNRRRRLQVPLQETHSCLLSQQNEAS